MTKPSDEFIHAVADAANPVTIETSGKSRLAYDVTVIPGANQLPYALVVLLENVVRGVKDPDERVRQAHAIVSAGLAGASGDEIAFMPARVLFQDFTGVPVFVDFAAMRDAAQERGIDPALVNPRIPCSLVVDHSVIADVCGTSDAVERNEGIEARRNHERFSFLKWASQSFDNVEIVPPGGGICHQLNIERFCTVVGDDALATEGQVACFDTLVGTDSHTTTANGIGVLGWGVGGIEAEAATLGQPISMLVPPVVELRLTGALRPGVCGMDLALTVCELLRSEGVVGTLVEVTGEGVSSLSATQRSCVANMTPEYGATTTLFPVDATTLDYLRLTGRDEADVTFAEAYLAMQGCLDVATGRTYSRTISLDLAQVERSLAGPSRPHRRVSVGGLKARFEEELGKHGGRTPDERFCAQIGDEALELGHGTVALAAITSCTTATDPSMMVAAGLLAKKALERGLETKPWVKTILAPGSVAVSLLLKRAGLDSALARLGFFTCGFGCMSCIGNSGEIDPGLHELCERMELCSVLSGNRNFDGRISPDVAQNYLAQPALVVAYALAGTVDVDLASEPIGLDEAGKPVMLEELMPSDDEVRTMLDSVLEPSLYAEGTRRLMVGSAAWQSIETTSSATFAWDPDSTYIRRAPYFEMARTADSLEVRGARVLARLGDFVTTDHISPAGSIAKDSPAARYLEERGVERPDFNTYGARRGNHEVMARGTFANTRLENALADGRSGGWTKDPLSSEILPIYDASAHAQTEGLPLVVIAGKMYGSGSSRDWAAKGPLLLGVRAVIAESFERIHRSNLVQMGIVPLQFKSGESADSLGLNGDETFDIATIPLTDGFRMGLEARVTATDPDGSVREFACDVRIDTPGEASFIAAGGILPYVLGRL